MAFMNKNLSVIAYADGFTLWHYKTNDAIAEVENPAYFTKVWMLMNAGDIIIINCKDGAYFRQILCTHSGLVDFGKMGD